MYVVLEFLCPFVRVGNHVNFYVRHHLSALFDVSDTDYSSHNALRLINAKFHVSDV